MMAAGGEPVIRRALISVSDKTGIVELARFLQARRVEILSTGGTSRLLREQGVAVVDVSAYTGVPEMMDGRLKTLHPKIHGGLLWRGEQDRAVMAEHAIEAIDLLVVNLYPFEEITAGGSASQEQGIENIDIGGPAMIRAAAKNHERVTVIVDPADYGSFMSRMSDPGEQVSPAWRSRLAVKAFQRTAEYDAAIFQWLGRTARPRTGDDFGTLDDTGHWLPKAALSLDLVSGLRYGENPHQRAAFYTDEKSGLAHARQLQGKPLSYNNLVDASVAYECVFSFEEVACAIIKHASPCGVACAAASPAQAYQRAVEADTLSAFGGIVAFNREVDAQAATAISDRQFIELVIAPGASPDAAGILAKKSGLRVLVCAAPEGKGLRYQSILGGILVQEGDYIKPAEESFKVVTERAPDKDETADLLFAWQVVRYVKSNAIVFAHARVTVGIGGGQTARVASVRIATEKSRAFSGGRVCMASDAFFPFCDSIELAADAGVSAVIQPGGSIHDDEVIAAANERDVAMVFTGVRHFRH